MSVHGDVLPSWSKSNRTNLQSSDENRYLSFEGIELPHIRRLRKPGKIKIQCKTKSTKSVKPIKPTKTLKPAKPVKNDKPAKPTNPANQ